MRERCGSALKRGIALAACAAVLALAGCGRTSQGRDYTLRGVIVSLPNPAADNSLQLHHEPIDEWVSRDGRAEGMDSMTMPFAVAKGVSLEGLGVNDKVEATLHVDWEDDLPVRITGLRKLPADTRLDFREARPPGTP